MAKTLPQEPDSSPPVPFGPLRASFLRYLAAENKSPSTQVTYGAAIEQLAT
jgi:hypothetical protein